MLPLLLLTQLSVAADLSPDLKAIQSEVHAELLREAKGDNGAASQFFEELQSKFKKPKPNDDWLVDSYMLIGAQRVVVQRADPFLMFREQLTAAYVKRLNLPDKVLRARLQAELKMKRAKRPDLWVHRLTCRHSKRRRSLLASTRFQTHCEVPYIAGYATNDGNQIFIDREVADAKTINGKSIPIKTLLNVRWNGLKRRCSTNSG